MDDELDRLCAEMEGKSPLESKCCLICDGLSSETISKITIMQTRNIIEKGLKMEMKVVFIIQKPLVI